MKRSVLAIFVLLILVADAAAQTNPKLRPRWGSRIPDEPVQSAPSVTVQSPVPEQVYTTTDPFLVLSGTTTPGSAPIQSVVWSNNRGGSGNAIGTSPTWQTEAGTSSQVKFQDNFTTAGTTALATTIGTPVGGPWTEAVNSTGGTVLVQRRVGNWAQLNTGAASGTFISLATLSSVLSGTDYDVALKLQAVSDADSDDGAAIVFGYVNSTNYCAALWYGAGGALDMYLVSVVGGAVSNIGSPYNGNPALDDIMLVEVRGNDLTFRQNGNARITGTTGDCDAGTGVGIGFGALRGVAGDDGSSRWHLDDFTVTDHGVAAGGIELQPGENIITITATDSNSLTGVDTIIVTLEVTDTIDPTIQILGPVNADNYTVPPATPLTTISGITADNTAVDEVTWTCTNVSDPCSPTSGTATLTPGTPNDTWSFQTTPGEGTSTIVVTSTDTQGNQTPDTLTTFLNSADSTAPTLTITSDGGSGAGASFSTASPTVTIAGTAFDAVGVSNVTGTCVGCTVGPRQGGLTNWSFLVTLASGANALTFRAFDAAGNQSTGGTITVTYLQTLNISTTFLPTVTEDVSLPGTYCLAATGGSGTKVWSKDSGTYPAGVSFNTSTGCFTGTPTTPGAHALVMRVTDSSGFDTQALTMTIVATGSETSHTFFETMTARSECFRSYSFRPQTGITAPYGTLATDTVGVGDCTKPRWAGQLTYYSANTRITYCYTGSEPGCSAADTHPEKQDAAKIVMPTWRSGSLVVASAMDSTQTILPLNSTQSIETNKGWKVENEIMRAPATVAGSANVPVERSAYYAGTNAAHAQGTPVQVYSSSYSSPDQVRVPIKTNGLVSANYLFIFDLYYTNSFMKTGLTNHKTFQISYWGDGKQFIETNANYNGPTGLAPNPQWAATGGTANNVAAFGTRFYGQSVTPGARQDGPALPMSAPFLLKPSKWTRFYVLVEANSEQDFTKFAPLSGGRAPLASAITDTTTTSINVDHTGISTNPFTSCPFVCGGADTKAPFASWQGRSLKIDNEIMTIAGCTVCTGPVRTLTVVRGAYGSTPGTHTAGTQVQTIEDYVTIFVADEDQEPVVQFDRVSWHLPIHHSSPTNPGSMFNFWVEFNTSTAGMTQGRVNGPDGILGTADDLSDLVAYARNVVILKDPVEVVPGNNASWASLRVKPIR